jgi:creatinine amidohydrolase/Fe(II)-dependent formamide hydrolase-like protein
MEINENVGSQIVDRMGLSSERFSPGYTRSGAIFQQAQDYLALLWKIANQVHALGFEAVIFFNGHYPLSHYGRFLEHLVQRHLKMRTWAGHEGDLLAEAGDPGHGDHAGKWETSLMMAVDDSRVRLDALREADEFIGCGTDALESSREHGEEWARRIVCALADKARALLHH